MVINILQCCWMTFKGSLHSEKKLNQPFEEDYKTIYTNSNVLCIQKTFNLRFEKDYKTMYTNSKVLCIQKTFHLLFEKDYKTMYTNSNVVGVFVYCCCFGFFIFVLGVFCCFFFLFFFLFFAFGKHLICRLKRITKLFIPCRQTVPSFRE